MESMGAILTQTTKTIHLFSQEVLHASTLLTEVTKVRMTEVIAFKVVSVEAMEEWKLVIVVPSTSFKYFNSQHRQFKYKKDNRMSFNSCLGF